MRESLDRALRAEIRATDSDDNHEVNTLRLPAVADGFTVCDEGFRSLVRESLPTEEIVAGALLALEHIICLEGLLHIILILCIFDKGVAASYVYFYHIFKLFVSSLS